MSPFATLSFQFSIFIHAAGGQENVEGKELNGEQGTSLLCALPSSHETHLLVIR